MLYAKRPLNPVQILIVTPYEVMGAEVRGSEPKVQVFVCYQPPKHPLDAVLALYETLPALVWEKTFRLGGGFQLFWGQLGNRFSLGGGTAFA